VIADSETNGKFFGLFAMNRRTLLKAGVAQFALLGLLRPTSAQAIYPLDAFKSKDIPQALNTVLGAAELVPSEQITIEVPHVASDKNVVPLRISSALENIESISVVFEGNQFPFTAYFRLYDAQSHISTRIKVEQPGDMLVVVKAGGALHTSKRSIRISNGVCKV
jgi:sulfur-oxidizing protein SoxY